MVSSTLAATVFLVEGFMLDISTQVHGGVVIVRLNGVIARVETPELRELFAKVLKTCPCAIIVITPHG